MTAWRSHTPAVQILFTSAKLAHGSHTVTVVKESGTYMLVDAFQVE
jgi:hypothetical protein